jgi:dTDP-4-amino-4,6-dideoxygalactose transaminase
MLAERNGRPIASYAEEQNLYVCWSLQAIKHLTSGDGGLLVCPTEEATARARKLRWFGLDRRAPTDFRAGQLIEEAGYKFHMNDISASIGLGNLSGLNAAVARHRAHAHRYHLALADVGPEVQRPPWDEGSSWWLYTIRVTDRSAFQRHMKDAGIETSPVHRRTDEHPAFRASRSPLPGLDEFSRTEVAIPVGWWLADEDVERVITAVRTWAART